MIVITGAAGFIGSVVLGYLNSIGMDNIAVFDDLPDNRQCLNLATKKFKRIYAIDEVADIRANIDRVIHLGANSNTLEQNWQSLYKTNIQSTRQWSKFCEKHAIPFIFASSASVTGNGLGPLNNYALTKLISEREVNGAILRLFNVYGPNEYHKGRMASTIFHWYNQIQTENEFRVFVNSNQFTRDFIWVEDVAKVIHQLVVNFVPGNYDVGTGVSTKFSDVANALQRYFPNAKLKNINMPPDLTAQYQISTKANVTALNSIGIDTDQFLTVDQGVTEYIKYLDQHLIY
jgi:ADP-L-glycero-D-manno-heptose 6-epimerase